MLTPAGFQVGGGWEITHRHAGPQDRAYFGSIFAGVGDVDQDGCADYAVTGVKAPPDYPDLGLLVFSGRTSAPLYSLVGTGGLNVGSALASAGDLNQDGVPDILVGGSSASPGGVHRAGAVFVFSGVDGSVLLEIDGTITYEQFGGAVAGGGDVNGDGVPDLVVGTPYEGNSSNFNGDCRVFSGADGSLLYRYDGTTPFSGFSQNVAILGDWDADGCAEFAYSYATFDPGGMPDAGAIFVHSGATGALLHLFVGESQRDRFGYSFAAAGDVDADGIGDVIVGAPYTQVNGSVGAGTAYVYSGRTRLEMLRVNGRGYEELLGLSVASAGNQDGDGHADLLVGVPYANSAWHTDSGSALVISGRTGVLLHRIDGEDHQVEIGSGVGLAGDLDGDGTDHFFVWAPGADAAGFVDSGELRIFALEPFLALSAGFLSASAGGSVLLDLDFPDDAGGGLYQILVSGTGTGPTRRFGLDVPLTPDAWFSQSLDGQYPAYAVGFRGVLSTEGQSGALLSAAPGQIPSALAGRTLWLAAVARDLSGAGTYSSMARSILLLP